MMMIFKNSIGFCLLLASALTFNACKKDLSTQDTNKIEGVSVDTTGMGVLTVQQFNHLVINPKISTAQNDANLDYEWRLSMRPSDTTSQVLGKTKNLDAEIGYRPTSGAQFHHLRLIVTDKTNGLKYITAWQLRIQSSIGEGLVIAETADGMNSDLSHIMSPLVTMNATGEAVKYNIYSAVNGTTIPGVVKDLHYNVDIRGLFGITDNSIFKVNTADYTLAGKNDDLFFGHTGAYSPQFIGPVSQGDVYIEGGKFYSNYLGVSKKWGVPFDSKFNVPGIVSLNANHNTASDLETVLTFYDETAGKFVYLQTIQSFGDRNMYAIPSVSGKAFDPGNLPGKTNVAASFGPDEDLLHLLKDKSTGKLALYVLTKAIDNYPSPLTPSAPKAVYDLSNAPGIAEATKFLLYDGQRVMYYATPTKIYVMLFGGATPIFEERYTVPAGEQITTMQMFQQADHLYGYGPFISTNNKQLILSTYNGTEGKVRILPISSLGSGAIDQANIKTYGGFKKVTAITHQK